MSADNSLKGSLGQLVDTPSPWAKALLPLPPAQPIPAQSGRGVPSAQSPQSLPGGGAGFSLGGPVTITSTDGVFSITFAETLATTIGTTTYKLPVVG